MEAQIPLWMIKIIFKKAHTNIKIPKDILMLSLKVIHVMP